MNGATALHALNCSRFLKGASVFKAGVVKSLANLIVRQLAENPDSRCEPLGSKAPVVLGSDSD